MFEAVELGRKVTKEAFDKEEPKLHTALLDAQRRAKEAGVPVIILVAGFEGSGKGDLVNRLSKWLDSRGMETAALWHETDEEKERPNWWRYWRLLPGRGNSLILFGGWYRPTAVKHSLGTWDLARFERELLRIADFERMLSEDGVLFLKFWLHLSSKERVKRLKKKRKRLRKILAPIEWLDHLSKDYESFASVIRRMIRVTDLGYAPWYLIESEDKRYRDLAVGHTILKGLEHRLAAKVPIIDHGESTVVDLPGFDGQISILDTVDLESKVSHEDYQKRVKELQAQLNELTWAAYQQQLNTVIVFEGWDASGKGGTIRRLTAGLDARLYRVIRTAAPTDEEAAHHYLWRFWRHVPRKGFITIYDRSWYGRVLVERVEGFAAQHEWMRAFREINDFEEQLHLSGAQVLKFWLHIDQEEQLRRFKEREHKPWKLHKITDEDWRNREKWAEYAHAVQAMVSHTSTGFAPWQVVPANDKKFARLFCLQKTCEVLAARLNQT